MRRTSPAARGATGRTQHNCDSVETRAVAHCARECISLHVLTRSIYPLILRWWCAVQNGWRTDGRFSVETDFRLRGDPPWHLRSVQGKPRLNRLRVKHAPIGSSAAPSWWGQRQHCRHLDCVYSCGQIQVFRPHPRRPLHNQASSQQTCIAGLCCPALKIRYLPHRAQGGGRIRCGAGRV